MKKFAAVIWVLVLAGCVGTSLPAKFYNLNAFENSITPLKSSKRVSIGIEAVKIPSYIDRPQIVTMKKNSVELEVSEIHRWSEPLSSAMQRVIANDMAAYLPNAVVKPRNYSREDFDYIVFVEVNALDAQFDDKAVLDAWWSVFNRDGKTVLRERTKLERPLKGGYDNMVEAQSVLIDELSHQIAAKIIKL